MLLRFTCKSCGESTRKIVASANDVKDIKCTCGGACERSPNPPSTHVMETLDNGAMPRALERRQNAEELYREHAASDPRRRRV